MTIVGLEHQLIVSSRISDWFSLQSLSHHCTSHFFTGQIYQFLFLSLFLPGRIGCPGLTSGTLNNLQLTKLSLSLAESFHPAPRPNFHQSRERSVDSVTELFDSRNNEWSSGADNESGKTETDRDPSRSLLLYRAGREVSDCLCLNMAEWHGLVYLASDAFTARLLHIWARGPRLCLNMGKYALSTI